MLRGFLDGIFVDAKLAAGKYMNGLSGITILLRAGERPGKC